MVQLNVLNIFNQGSSPSETIEFPDELFFLACSENAIQTVYYIDNAVRKRSNAHTKERWAVSGTTKKAYKQKGTGRARHGTLRASQFRGGGVTFGPLSCEKRMKVNKKLRMTATFTALMEHIQKGTLVVANDFVMQEIKTKTAFDALSSVRNSLIKDTIFSENFASRKSLGCLLIGDSNDVLSDKFTLSSRNIVGVKFICDSHLNVFDLVTTNFLIISKSALMKVISKFKERLGE
jgi:large subunit ribosomal protein L4